MGRPSPLDAPLGGGRKELADAVAGAGKEVFFGYVVLNGQPLPDGFAQAFPDYASWVPQAQDILAGEALRAEIQASGVDPQINPPDPPVANHYTTMSTSTFTKQQKGNWCGPTSLKAFVDNSPTSTGYQGESQAYWANKLGVTQPGTSTDIHRLTPDINTYTTWDTAKHDGASSAPGAYMVHSIASWTLDQWENVFDTQLGIHHAPIQLHPMLKPGNNDYYPTKTSGHFDVGRGYNLDYPGDGKPTAHLVYIFEPAGGPAEGGVFKSTTATDTFEDVRQANLDNTAQRDIAY